LSQADTSPRLEAREHLQGRNMEEPSRTCGDRRPRRERVPRQLRKLFRLRYLEGVRDRKVLAHALGVSRKTLREYFYRLGQRLTVDGASTNSEVLVEKSLAFICPECLAMTVRFVGATRVCSRCGLELGRWEMDDSLPFDTTFAPMSGIALGRSLGSTLPKSRTYKVLMKSQTGDKDIGLRARFINILHESNETPTAKRLLEYGSNLLQRLSLDDDHILANIYGNHLRQLADYLSAKGLNHTHRYAQALLGELAEGLIPQKAEQIKRSLRYDADDRQFIHLWIKLDRLAAEDE